MLRSEPYLLTCLSCSRPNSNSNKFENRQRLRHSSAAGLLLEQMTYLSDLIVMSAIGTKRTSLVAPRMSAFGGRADIAPVLLSEDRIDHPPDSVSRCRELIAVAVSQIDGDPIVGDRLVDPALEITVAHFKKIIALQRAGRRNPMAHENAEDLTANVFVGRSVKHRSTIGFARHRSYGRTATVDKIAQPMGQPCPARSKRRRRKSTTKR